jgi:hypothetical protein
VVVVEFGPWEIRCLCRVVKRVSNCRRRFDFPEKRQARGRSSFQRPVDSIPVWSRSSPPAHPLHHQQPPVAIAKGERERERETEPRGQPCHTIFFVPPYTPTRGSSAGEANADADAGTAQGNERAVRSFPSAPVGDTCAAEEGVALRAGPGESAGELPTAMAIERGRATT